jgi:hypothetical protein
MSEERQWGRLWFIRAYLFSYNLNKLKLIDTPSSSAIRWQHENHECKRLLVGIWPICMMKIGQVKERNPNSNDIYDGILALSWTTDANRAVGGDDNSAIAAEYLLDGDVMNGNSDRTSSSV